MPSRMDMFGLMTSLALTKSTSPMYKWFVGTKTLYNSSSPSSVCHPEMMCQ
uniref:COV1 n=1 Tax=Solanum tuberosum TaxID=4113 RepID=M1BQR3_SOLTU